MIIVRALRGSAWWGAHRRRFVADTLQDLQTSLQGLDQRLVLLHGPVAEVLPACARQVGADTVFCEDIAAPEEEAQVQALTGGPVDFALLAVGGVRADLPAGELRQGEASLSLLPFKSPLSVLTLSGTEVRALLTETITATLPASAHAGKFPYGGHLRYTFTETELVEDGRNVGELSDTAKHIANAALRWDASDKWNWSLRGEYRGDSRRFDGDPAALTGNITVNTPAWAAGTVLRPVIHSHTVHTLAARP